ncbi:glycoside hydrolase superfamily [Dendryphion nanum]|uniref:Glycoside hydrolase superfamily n=1 Tax=Dendryphion nanum TaxID=256645 RepID=A0A9P9EF68_9PLEO|nr:glycoside hydrolase superfamily [Dendryphion nanum]
MKGFFQKAKAEIEGILDSNKLTSPAAQQHTNQQQTPGQPKGMALDDPSTIQEPSAVDILRYRYHHGTNLGSIYVLEKWLSPSRFPENAAGSSELEAVKSWVDKIGIEETKRKFQDHWANAVSDADIKWLLEEAKCTTIRLPIGYFDLDPSLIKDTPFEPYAAVYANAWSSIWTLVSRLRAHSIGTIIDLHALPGGANSQEHSGTNFGTTQLWTHEPNRALGVRCCQFVAQEVAKGLEVAGIQLVNEAEWNSERMYEWYDECISTISAIDSSIPVIISDAWNLSKAVDYSLKKNAVRPSKPTNPVIIDTHYYWAFSDEDKRKSPQTIIAEVNTKLTELDGKEGSVLDRGAVQIIVGEYSCVLTEDSWAAAGDISKEDLVKQFGQAQSKRYQERTGGAFFWTWKMDWFPGGEWGFAEQTNNGAIAPHAIQNIPYGNIPSILEIAHHRRDERMYYAVNQHVTYWDHLSPNMGGEHWRFESGWKVGYHDALIFFEGRGRQAVVGGNRIGNLEVWVLKRVRESGFRGDFVWEFEQGLRRGIHDFYSVVGL